MVGCVCDGGCCSKPDGQSAYHECHAGCTCLPSDDDPLLVCQACGTMCWCDPEMYGDYSPALIAADAEIDAS